MSLKQILRESNDMDQDDLLSFLFQKNKHHCSGFDEDAILNNYLNGFEIMEDEFEGMGYDLEDVKTVHYYNRIFWETFLNVTENLQEELFLFRVLFLDDFDQFDEDEMNMHWTIDPTNLKNPRFFDSISVTYEHGGENPKLFILYGEISKRNCDFPFKTNWDQSIEKELNILGDINSFKTLYVCRYREFNGHVPHQSKILKKLK